MAASCRVAPFLLVEDAWWGDAHQMDVGHAEPPLFDGSAGGLELGGESAGSPRPILARVQL